MIEYYIDSGLVLGILIGVGASLFIWSACVIIKDRLNNKRYIRR